MTPGRGTHAQAAALAPAIGTTFKQVQGSIDFGRKIVKKHLQLCPSSEGEGRGGGIDCQLTFFNFRAKHWPYCGGPGRSAYRRCGGLRDRRAPEKLRARRYRSFRDSIPLQNNQPPAALASAQALS
jgi:hypothetical protein